MRSTSGSKATVRGLFEINHISSFRACENRKSDKLLGTAHGIAADKTAVA